MIYVTGELNTDNWPEQKALTRNDYLIVCGDMGLVWDRSKHDRRRQEWFEDKPFTTLFVDGNHENHPALAQYPVEMWNGGKIHRIQPHVIHLMRGQVFDLDGTTLFAMGGASSHDKEYRVEGISWWPEELPSDAEYEEAIKNLEANDWQVDLVVSHCTADSVQEQLAYWYEHDKLTNFFEAVVREKLDYRHWYFGHYHTDKDIDDLHTCLYQGIEQIRIGWSDEMERLTNKREADLQRRSYETRLKQGYPRNIPEERFLRLAAYENTGLEPEDINLMVQCAHEDHELLSTATHIRELLQAEQQGHLIITPCAVGDTVYKICPISTFLEIGELWDGRIVQTDCQRCAYYSCDCHNIGYNKEARNVVVERKMSRPEQIVRCMPYFGTIYFLTREEAEAEINRKASQNEQHLTR